MPKSRRLVRQSQNPLPLSALLAIGCYASAGCTTSPSDTPAMAPLRGTPQLAQLREVVQVNIAMLELLFGVAWTLVDTTGEQSIPDLMRDEIYRVWSGVRSVAGVQGDALLALESVVGATCQGTLLSPTEWRRITTFYRTRGIAERKSECVFDSDLLTMLMSSPLSVLREIGILVARHVTRDEEP